MLKNLYQRQFLPKHASTSELAKMLSIGNKLTRKVLHHVDQKLDDLTIQTESSSNKKVYKLAKEGVQLVESRLPNFLKDPDAAGPTDTKQQERRHAHQPYVHVLCSNTAPLPLHPCIVTQSDSIWQLPNMCTSHKVCLQQKLFRGTGTPSCNLGSRLDSCL